MNKNKKIVLILIAGLSLVGAMVKANTKARVFQLEEEVVKLSKSERKAWQQIEEMNKKVSDLERDIAIRSYQTKRALAAAAEEEEDLTDDYSDDYDDELEDDNFEYEA